MTTFQKGQHIYFIGIGGISMSGLAEILADKGCIVSGTDIKESPVTKHLQNLGIHINFGHKAENITDDVDLVVYTAAIHPDNPEYQAAQAKHIPLMDRARGFHCRCRHTWQDYNHIHGFRNPACRRDRPHHYGWRHPAYHQQ